MNISFDKFLDFIRQWSAGRLTVLVLLVSELIFKLKKDTSFMEPVMLFKLISMAILLEVLESVFGKMKPDGKGFWLYLATIIISLGGIVIIALSMVFNFSKEIPAIS